MADNITIKDGNGASKVVAAKDLGSVFYTRHIPVDSAGNEITHGRSFSASATFTPAASSHTNGDAVGTAQEFALGAVSGSRIKITSATLEIDGGSTETTAWRLHLFNVTPASALSDTGDFVLAVGDRAAYLGYIDFPQVLDLGDTLYIDVPALNKQIKLAGTSVFGYLVNGTTLTPAAVAHIVTLHAESV